MKNWNSGWRPLLGGALMMMASAFVAASTDSSAATTTALGMSSLAAGGASKSTADHSKFKELQGPFSSGPDCPRMSVPTPASGST